MAVDVLLAGRSGGRGVVNAGALDARTPARRGGVVQADGQTRARLEGSHDVQRAGGQKVGVAAGGSEGAVGLAVVVGNAGGAEPGGGGAAALGEEDTDEELEEASLQAAVQAVGQ